MKDLFIEKLAEILECEISELSDDLVFRNHDRWDSLAFLSTIAMIDDHFGLVIMNDDFEPLKTISDILEYIESNK
jgi:acyl carrier protein